ncbi:hypothetical protein DFH06DRAFT_1346255 [Mycena polygramma]|nr:hypothetical protein DFH06DRAFT_1346255 [Mycena polygramma]
MGTYSGDPWFVPETPRSNTGAVLQLRSYEPTGGSFSTASFSINTPPSTSRDSSFENIWGTPVAFLSPQSGPPPSVNSKRRRAATIINDENTPPSPVTGNAPKKPRTSAPRKKSRTASEKIDAVLASIQEQGWTLGEFLYNVFDHQGRDGSRSQKQAQMVSSFLGGQGRYRASDILTCWMSSPDGVLHAHDPHLTEMYSTDTPFTEIGPVRAALTSFALQTVGDLLARGAETAVHSSSGLHVSPTSQNPVKKMGWLRIGANTIPFVASVLELHLKPAMYLLARIATRKPRIRDGIAAPPRKHRPAQGVIVHALADLLFCRTKNANLLPLARGILYFGCSVPVDIMAYNSRIGTMPAYSTTHHHLEGLSSEEALVTFNHGSDPSKLGIMLFDNIQNMARVRDLRIGRENHMNVGMSCLYVEAWDCINRLVFDLGNKRQRIMLSERANLSVDRLFSLLDQADAETTGHLAWLEVAVRCIEQLKHWTVEVKARYRATAKLVIPLQKSVVHPLAPSGKKETIPSELKEGLLDFLQQIGQTATSYLPRKLVIGGDGLSAGKIGRSAPSNMKKVEFYPGSQLLYLVLDARMLDCWSLLLGTDDIFSHFESLAKQKKLPELEDLVEMSKKLHRTYSTARGRDHAIHDTGATSAWAKTVPRGSAWVPIKVEDSSLDTAKKKKKSGAKKKKEKPVPPPCKGDFVLAQAIDFIRDGLNSRKMATAVAEGDVGRLYECIKYMLFTFGGSTHSNYLNYVLETIINLDLESSPGLREALLMCQLVNLRGGAGTFEEGDYVVEFFNRLLEDIVQHKNAQFDDKFIRNVVSRNLRHIAELKLAWRTSTGMAQKSHVHSDPHTKPEMRILLKLYHTEELHSRRLGRQIDDRDTDNFAKGVKKLREGGLKKFIDKSLRTRQPRQDTTLPTPSPAADASASDDEADGDTSSDESDDDPEAEDQFYATRGSMTVVDGELVMDGRDMMEGPEEIIPEPESDDEDDAEEN